MLVDRFPDANIERLLGAAAVIDRPLFVADALALPFADRAFDFVNCSHLLEHVLHPDRLLRELSRVSDRGYIETPSPVYEKLWGWPFHRWLVHVDGDRLVIEAKDRRILDEDLHDWFDRGMQEPDFWNFILRRLHRLDLLTCYLWDGEARFELRIERHVPPETFASGFDAPGHASSSPSAPKVGSPAAVKSAIARRGRRESDKRLPDVVNRLVCPDCRHPVAGAEQLMCTSCGRSFQIQGLVTVMLPATVDGAQREAQSRWPTTKL